MRICLISSEKVYVRIRIIEVVLEKIELNYNNKFMRNENFIFRLII